MRLFIYLIISSISFACNPSQETKSVAVVEVVETKLSKDYVFPYQTDNPSESRKLPKKLKEISGLSIDEEGNIFAVQDENGIVFKITEEDIEETEFRKDGDYEGIEVVGNHVYVIKSSGTVYKISNLGKPEQIREDFNDFLDDDNDVEGLGYDKESNSLLLVCKGHGKEKKGVRGVYKFNLETNKLDDEPYFRVDIEAVLLEVKHCAEKLKDEAFLKLIEKKGNDITFAPSAIAVHPISKNLYMTSSRGKMLLVTNNKGEIIHLAKLDKSIHEQPEGLAFDAAGNLYISNEGKDKEGMIYKFDYTSAK